MSIIIGNLEKGVAEVILIQVAVPSSGSIRVREMPKIVRYAVPMVPAGAGMGMDSSAIAGKCEVFLWNQPALYGRENGSMVKKELEPLFKIIKDAFACHQPSGNDFCDFRSGFLRFLLFAVP